jgi:hypothetical protein
MYQSKKVLPATYLDLTDQQIQAAGEIGHVTKVWMVDENVPAIAVGTSVTDKPTHWWQDNRWEKVSFEGHEW